MPRWGREEAVMLPFFKKVREAKRPRCTAVVAAAGSSTRMGGVNKLLQPLEGVPVLVRTLAALQITGSIDEIVKIGRASCRERVSLVV